MSTTDKIRTLYRETATAYARIMAELPGTELAARAYEDGRRTALVAQIVAIWTTFPEELHHTEIDPRTLFHNQTKGDQMMPKPEPKTETAHYTAWLTRDPSCLDQPCMDVTVLEDEATDKADGTLVWQSKEGDPEFYTVTTVDAREGEASEGMKQAADLLEGAGWRTVGDWTDAGTASIITVERT